MDRNLVPSAPVHLPAVGEMLAGKYLLRGVLGRGGMGVVFDGYHDLLERRVAIKVLRPEILSNREAVTRFLNEARAAARVNSDHVVRVIDVGLLDNGLPFIVMERLEGADLAQLVASGGVQSLEEAVDLLVEGMEGVIHAHLEGIIHRDLKPSNFFLARRPDRSTVVKVLDFGISKLSDLAGGGSVTSTSSVFGSPNYMSPEQFLSAKGIDVRSDIWSLGAIAYEFFTGRLPHIGETMVAIYAAIQDCGPRPLREIRAEIPPGLEAAVLKCLRKSRDERFSTVYAFAETVAPFGTNRSLAVLQRLESHVSSSGASARLHSQPRPLANYSSGSVLVAAKSPSVPPTSFRGSTLPPSASASRIVPLAGVTAPSSGTASPWSSTGRKPGSLGGRSVAFGIAFGAVVVVSIGAGLAVTRSRGNLLVEGRATSPRPSASEATAPAGTLSDVRAKSERPTPVPAPSAAVVSIARVAPLVDEAPLPSPVKMAAAEKKASETLRPAPRATPSPARNATSEPSPPTPPGTTSRSGNPLIMQPF